MAEGKLTEDTDREVQRDGEDNVIGMSSPEYWLPRTPVIESTPKMTNNPRVMPQVMKLFFVVFVMFPPP